MNTPRFNLKLLFWAIACVLGLVSCGRGYGGLQGGAFEKQVVDLERTPTGDTDTSEPDPEEGVDNSGPRQSPPFEGFGPSFEALTPGYSGPQAQAIQQAVPPLNDFGRVLELYRNLASEAQAAQAARDAAVLKKALQDAAQRLKDAQLAAIASVVEQLSHIKPVIRVRDVQRARVVRIYYTADPVRVGKMAARLGSRFHNDGVAFTVWDSANQTVHTGGPMGADRQIETVPVYACNRYGNGNFYKNERGSFVSNDANCEGKGLRVSSKETLGYASR